MADNNTSDQSEKGNDTGVHPPASEELPSGGPFLEGPNQDDLSTYSNETTLTDKILTVPATGSDKTDTEANALTAHSDTSVPVSDTEANAAMTHSNANKVSNSKSKFHESLPGNNSGAVTPENSSKLQERRQDLQSGGEHSDTRCKNETLFHDSIQSSDTTVIPDDIREMDDHDSKRSPDIAGTPGDSHKGEDEDLTRSPDTANTAGDSHKGDNDPTRSPGITELSEYSDHNLLDSPTTQFFPERAGANQTPASPSTVVDNPGSPVVMSTPDNKFRTKYPHYESESGISQGVFGTGYNDTESGLGDSPSESGLGHSPSESGIEMSFNDKMNKRVKKTSVLEERIKELEAKIRALEEEKKLQGKHAEELQNLLQEKDGLLKEIDDLQEAHEKKIQSLQEELRKSREHPDSNETSKEIADRIKELQKQINDKESLYQGSRNEVERLQKNVDQSLGLKQQIDEKEKQLQSLQDQINQLNDKHAQDLGTLQRQLDEANKQETNEEKRSSSENSSSTLTLQKQIDENDKKIDVLEKEIERIKENHAEDVGTLQKELNESKQKAVELQKKIVHLQAKEKEHNALKNKHDECEKSLQNLKKEMARLQDDHVTKTNTLRENLMKQHQEELQHLQDDHVTKTNALRENLMKQHQEELHQLQGTMAQCEEELASNKLILNNALLRELREKEEKDKCQHIIEEKRAEEVKILQERDRLEAALQSCRTKAKSSRTRCLLWKCVTYLRTLQLKNLENVYEGIVSEFEEQKRLNTTMQRALAESQEELDELKSTLQDERDAVSELQQDKATLEEKNAVLQDSHQQTKDQVSDRDQQIEKLKAQRKQLEKLKAKSDEQMMQAQVVNNTLQMQMVKLQHERVRENTLSESKISELTAQIRQREQQFLPLEMQVQQTMQELGSAHSRLEEVQACNHTLQEELHKATAALTERGRQEEALQSKIQDLSLKNSRYLHELFTVRRDLSVVTEKLRRTEVWMR